VTRAARAVTLALGLVAGAYGVLLLLELGWANTRATLVWLVGGVVLHDAAFAPVVLVVSLAALRLAGPKRLAPWTVALVVLVPVTLVAIPVLGRFGEDPRNATLLDRNYWLGWSALVTLVALTVLVGTAASRRRDGPEGGDDGAGDGGR
jgi:hypothetical protein